MIDQTALCIALRAAGYTMEEIFQLLDGWVWLGDLSGMEAVPMPDREGLYVAHRCGHAWDLPPMGGMVSDGSVMLGNLAEYASKVRDTHACARHEPSPEHRERVARWAAAAGPQPARAGTLAPMSNGEVRTILGDTAADQLDVVRALTRRTVNGPGCTPATVRVECLGDGCTGCSDPQCWTARADGGDV